MRTDHLYMALILLLAATPILFVTIENEYLGEPLPAEGATATRGIRAPFNFLYDGRADAELIRSRFVPVLTFDQKAYDEISDGIQSVIFSPATSKLGISDDDLDAILTASDVFTQAQLIIKVISPPTGSQLSSSQGLGGAYLRNADNDMWELLKDVDIISRTYPQQAQQREELISKIQALLQKIHLEAAKLLKDTLVKNSSRNGNDNHTAVNSQITTQIAPLLQFYNQQLDVFFAEPFLTDSVFNEIIAEHLTGEALASWMNQHLMVRFSGDLPVDVASSLKLPENQIKALQQGIVQAFSALNYFPSDLSKTVNQITDVGNKNQDKQADVRDRLRERLNRHVFGEQQTRQNIDKLLTEDMKRKLFTGLNRVVERYFIQTGAITERDRKNIIKSMGYDDPLVQLNYNQGSEPPKVLRLSSVNPAESAADELAKWLTSEPVIKDEVITYYWKVIRAFSFKPTYAFDADKVENELETLYRNARSHYYKRGELIVPSGNLIDAAAVLRLKAAADQRPRFFTVQGILAAVAGAAVLFAFAFYLWRFHGHELGRTRVFPFLLALLVSSAELLRIGSWFMPFATPYTPICFMAVFATLAINRRFGFIYIAFSSIFLVLAARTPASSLIFTIVVGFAAVHAAGKCVEMNLIASKRLFPIKAIQLAGLSFIALILALAWEGIIHLPNPVYLTGISGLWSFLEKITIESVNGLKLYQAAISTVLASAGWALLGFYSFPPLEKFLGTTSSLRLAKLKDPLQNKLLDWLSTTAPGTYRHSRLVADMVHNAAVAIGANAELVEVGALYHDIGKLTKAEHYGENLLPGRQNPHDLLTPQESARIIISHVENGVRLAEEYNVPKALIDLIKEHHGTTVAFYFYRKALETNGVHPVEIKEFEYPGPKPRTVESVLLMIADSVEAKFQAYMRNGQINSHADLFQLVREVIDDKRQQDQFVENPITESQLYKIQFALYEELIRLNTGFRPTYPATETEV